MFNDDDDNNISYVPIWQAVLYTLLIFYSFNLYNNHMRLVLVLSFFFSIEGKLRYRMVKNLSQSHKINKWLS